jgi:hypothetical protein
MSSVDLNINSNKDLQRYLKYDVALEFITRAYYNILGNDINKYIIDNNLIDQPVSITTVSNVKQSSEHANDIYVLIEVFNNNALIGHMTIHLINNVIRSRVNKGPIHITNNTNVRRCERVRLTRRTPNNLLNGFTFTDGTRVTYGHKLERPLSIVRDAIFAILNEYFNPSSQKSLTNNIYSHSAIPLLILYARRIENNNRSIGGKYKKQQRTLKLKKKI